jgi:signal transduction histidine kinase/ligand-binding sensor domain-containing protein
LWFGAWWGLARVEDDGRFTTIQKIGEGAVLGGGDHRLGSVAALGEDRAGRVWIGTLGGVSRVEGEVWRSIATKEGVPTRPARAFLGEADGTMWIGTDEGLVRHRAGTSRIYTRRDGLSHDAIRALLRDRDGNLWVGTQGGLSRLRGETFESDAPPPGLFDQSVSTLFEDREGNIWLGTRTGGLVRLRDGPFVSVLAPGRSGRIGTAIRGASDGVVWIGTASQGLLRVAASEVTAVTTAQGLCTDSVRTLEIDRQGRLWVGGAGTADTPNLCRLDAGGFRAFGPADGLPKHAVIRALLQGSTDFWVATTDALYRVDGDRLLSQMLPGRTGLHSLHEDREGTLWIGTDDAVLRRRAGDWERLDSRDGIPREWIYDIHQDAGGAVWIGTGAGFSRIVGRAVTTFGVRRGFFDDDVYGILEDDERALWLCSQRGIFRVRREEIDAVDRGARERITFSSYRAGDGLGTNTCEGSSGDAGLWRGPDGRLWFPTGRGAAYLDPRKLARGAAPPPLVLQQVLIDGAPVPIAGGALSAVAPGRGELSFSYAALTFTSPEKVRYRHRLEPLEQTWVDGDLRRTAHYLNVPSGNYRFRVAAILDGTAREVSTSVDVRLPPRLRERWWFVALNALALAAAGAGLLWWFQRSRLRRLNERHQLVVGERTRMARELHDTFSQGYTALAVQLEAATRRIASSPEKARQNLDQARMLVRDGLTDARRAVWALRPQPLEGGDLASALTEIARRLGAEAPVEVRVEGEPRRLAEDLEIALLRIGQEALTNAFKHAQARRIELTVSYGADQIGLRVADDGRGFAGERPPEGHFGLRGIRERVDGLGGQLRVRSGIGEGTELSVQLPAR